MAGRRHPAVTAVSRGGQVIRCPPRSRATFSTKTPWVTAYDPAERYPAGDFVNQHPGTGGLPTFAQGDAPLENTDVVLRHTFGLTHFPRPED
jgi:primary-amine oxidase